MIASAHDAVNVIALLIDHGADVDATDRATATSGRLALCYAALMNQLQAVKLLINKAANIEHKAVTGSTALMMAAQNNANDVMQLLLQHGANKQTALFYASRTNQARTVRFFIKNGADIGHTSVDSCTALMAAAAKNAVDAADRPRR